MEGELEGEGVGVKFGSKGGLLGLGSDRLRPSCTWQSVSRRVQGRSVRVDKWVSGVGLGGSGRITGWRVGVPRVKVNYWV